MKMPFGKHKGESLNDIPKGYLRWLLDNTEVRGQLKSAIEAVVDNNEGAESKAAKPKGRLIHIAIIEQAYQRVAENWSGITDVALNDPVCAINEMYSEIMKNV